MPTKWKYWSVCLTAILIVAVAGIPVSAGASGKLAVPGLSNISYLGGSNSENGNSIQTTTDGGYVIAGYTESTDHDVTGHHGAVGTQDVWVMKFSSMDSWRLCFGGNDTDCGKSIQQTTDGGYILAGYTRSTDGDVTEHHGSTGNYDAWVVRLNQTGSILWQKCLGGSGDDYGNAIWQTTDGGFILVGQTNSKDDDVTGFHATPGTYDAWVVKLNKTGGIQWQRCLGGSLEEVANCVQQTTDGGYILTGWTRSNDGDVIGMHTGGPSDVWAVKLSEDGLIQWQRCLGGTELDSADSIQQTTDGGYILVGYTASVDGDVSGKHGDIFHYDIWVVKLSSDGKTQWQRCLGGSELDLAYSIQQTTDGGYILAGMTHSLDGDVIGKHGSNLTEDAWVAKLDSAGLPLWQRCIGGSNDDTAYSIQQYTDEKYILTGYTWSADGDLNGHYGAADLLVAILYGPPTIDGITPAQMKSGNTQTIIITGRNLIQNGIVPEVTLLRQDTADIPLPVTDFSPDGKWIACTPGASSFVTPGLYTLRVMTPDYQYINVPNAFTVTCGLAPTVTSISPATGTQGAIINPLTIKGTRFWATGGITAYLNRVGQPNITTTVTGVTTTQITCEFLIPASAAPGKWNLVVKNPDGQYAMKKDAFTVTLRTFKPPRVSSVTPKTVTSGNTVFINAISGNFFNASASVAMTGPRGVSIPVSNVSVLSDTKITCDANLTAIGKGYATVTVTNPDGKKATKGRAFSIR